MERSVKVARQAEETVPLQDAAVSQTPGSVRPISPVAWSGGKGFDSIEESLTDEGGSKSKEDDVCADGGAMYLRRSLGAIFLGTDEQPALLNVLLVSIPLAFLARFLDWGHAWVFLSSLVALIPLAERISFVTEDVAKYTNQTLGGLLNATFGNITELVVCIFAIRAGLFRVVQLSMLGSVLSNLLLVLGSAFLVGGIRHKEQYFNRSAAVTNTGLLIFAVLALSLPSILDETHSGAGGVHTEIKANHPQGWLKGNGSLEAENLPGGDAPLWYSRFIALCMLLMYGLLIFFQLVTHTHLFEGEEEDEEEEDPGILGFYGGVVWLGIITVFIAALSQWIVDTIEGAAASLGMHILFISGILVPIVGNAAEHAAAVVFAYRNKMEIALGSAVGSAVQISVFVIPLCVVIGWMMDKPMTMNFHIFETSTMLLTSVSIAIILMDGKANWLKGTMLILGYCIIGAGFWAHADPDQMS
ncbi:Vacuolar cation/proton exchanger 5 (Ca(2+)/H(+) antiporter CAX5) (Ca(2+)/H(+) exchanger 5) (Protein CATION EXCHANGER 5) [Durusdinium trenchii]|uniref:Vacuolar cation/proton exchanger 5 (Ca(2+)/H(+) antiporter CAX5) (Ca(2+)/H(+) exchanger 5) (Protein CATION EXCHANGER 5) n=1 Tax=Durusdinium trenchii TaxID=1381693 RepID=A0ABP0KJI2_9DINO